VFSAALTKSPAPNSEAPFAVMPVTVFRRAMLPSPASSIPSAVPPDKTETSEMTLSSAIAPFSR